MQSVNSIVVMPLRNHLYDILLQVAQVAIALKFHPIDLNIITPHIKRTLAVFLMHLHRLKTMQLAITSPAIVTYVL